MDRIECQLDIITPPENLPRKSRYEEILELKDYLNIYLDTGSAASLVYVNVNPPSTNDSEKIWISTEGYNNYPPGVYIYKNNEWHYIPDIRIHISTTEPQGYIDSIWIKYDDDNDNFAIYTHDGTQWNLKYKHNNPIEIISQSSVPLEADINKFKDRNGILQTPLWIPKDSTDYISSLFVGKGNDPASITWHNIYANDKIRFLYHDANPPSEAWIARNFTRYDGVIQYPFWVNIGTGSAHPSAIYRKEGTRWISMSSITLVKKYSDIAISFNGNPSVSGSITVNYKDDGSELFTEEPYLLTQLYSDSQYSTLRWAVRPDTTEPTKKFICDYYAVRDGGDTRLVSIILVAVGYVAVNEVS